MKKDTTGVLDREVIKRVCLEKGFTVRPQANGQLDLNEYVYDTAQAFFELGIKAAKKESQTS